MNVCRIALKKILLPIFAVVSRFRDVDVAGQVERIVQIERRRIGVRGSAVTVCYCRMAERCIEEGENDEG